ncbi:ABC transporter permease [Vallitalea okinawensis]|uniref:ABC transporter permease n=1 Tax=Vallitalea okinawensis TaxID=2078660 RepID=UPI000CFCC700|nr:ABC-2 family transporter protein [Vallitalea okinawensis]
MTLFVTLFKASLKSDAQYKFDFVINIIGNFLGLFADFLIVAFILLRFQSIDGWELHEVALMYAIVEFGFGVYRFIGDGFNNFEQLILSGKFDTLLIRPAPALVQVMLQKVDFKRLGMILQALAVGIWGLSNVNFISTTYYIYLPILLVASVAMNLAISILLAAIAFWTGKNEDIIILGHYSTRKAASYPATIYHSIFTHALTFIIPFFTISYYPLLYLTGKSKQILFLIAPIIGVLVISFLAYMVWNTGIKRYSSTGT